MRHRLRRAWATGLACVCVCVCVCTHACARECMMRPLLPLFLSVKFLVPDHDHESSCARIPRPGPLADWVAPNCLDQLDSVGLVASPRPGLVRLLLACALLDAV